MIPYILTENEKEQIITDTVNIHYPAIPANPSDTSTGKFKYSQITQSFDIKKSSESYRMKNF